MKVCGGPTTVFQKKGKKKKKCTRAAAAAAAWLGQCGTKGIQTRQRFMYKFKEPNQHLLLWNYGPKRERKGAACRLFDHPTSGEAGGARKKQQQQNKTLDMLWMINGSPTLKVKIAKMGLKRAAYAPPSHHRRVSRILAAAREQQIGRLRARRGRFAWLPSDRPLRCASARTAKQQ